MNDAFVLPMAATHIGYAHGQLNSRGERHPGYDLNWGTSPNADLGRPVQAPTRMQVVEVGAARYYGNYVLAQSEALGYLFRFLHLNKATVRSGQWLRPEEEFAECGNSHYGGWPGMTAHLHYDLVRLSALNEYRLSRRVWTPRPELWDKVFVNPAALHPQLLRLKTLPGREVAEFEADFGRQA